MSLKWNILSPYSSDTLLLPSDSKARFLVTSALGLAQPLEGKRILLSELPSRSENDKWAVKLFSEKEAVSGISYCNPSGSSLELSWSAEDLPHLGLWVNYGEWSGCGSVPYSNIGVEPTNFQGDIPNLELNPPILSGNKTIQWELALTVK